MEQLGQGIVSSLAYIGTPQLVFGVSFARVRGEVDIPFCTHQHLLAVDLNKRHLHDGDIDKTCKYLTRICSHPKDNVRDD